MKRFKLLAILIVCITAISFVFSSCELGEDETTEYNPSGLDATNYSGSDRGIRVKNETTKRLVLFRGAINATNGDVTGGTILGVVPPGANEHGIAKKYLGGTAGFTMFVLEEDVYLNNKNNLTVLSTFEQTPYTRLFVVYNESGDNDIVYRISDKLGGENKLEIGNVSGTWNVELRLDGPQGPTLGFAPTGMIKTTLYLADDDYLLFPVFHRYNSTRDVLETKIPMFPSTSPAAGQAYYHQVALGAPPDGLRESVFNITEAMNLLTSASSGAAWLVVNNQSNTGVRLLQGSQIYRTASGTYTLNSGTQRQFPINMPMTQAGNSVTFGNDVTLASWKIGPVSNEVEIKDTTGNSNLTFKSDYMYTLTLTGSLLNGFVATIEMRTENNPETGEPYPGAPVPVDFN